MKRLLLDHHNYFGLIKEAFREALIRGIGNHDYFYMGYHIAPEPGELIEFKIGINDTMSLQIIRYHSDTFSQPRLKRCLLFNGTVPPSLDGKEPDFGFITQILKNYKSIG